MDTKDARRSQSEAPSSPLCIDLVTFVVKFSPFFIKRKIRKLNDFSIKVKLFGISDFYLVEFSCHQVFTADKHLSIDFR